MKCVNLIIQFQGIIEKVTSYVNHDTETWDNPPVHTDFMDAIKKEISPDIWEKFTEEDWNDYINDGYFVHGDYEFIIHHSISVVVSPYIKR
jgi:hypothetical protein